MFTPFAIGYYNFINFSLSEIKFCIPANLLAKASRLYCIITKVVEAVCASKSCDRLMLLALFEKDFNRQSGSINQVGLFKFKVQYKIAIRNTIVQDVCRGATNYFLIGEMRSPLADSNILGWDISQNQQGKKQAYEIKFLHEMLYLLTD